MKVASNIGIPLIKSSTSLGASANPQNPAIHNREPRGTLKIEPLGAAGRLHGQGTGASSRVQRASKGPGIGGIFLAAQTLSALLRSTE